MPTSDASNLSPIVNEVVRLRPHSILDLGIGYGKYGSLLREYLDVAQYRIAPHAWRVDIIGVEGFADYKNPMWDLYSQVRLEDFTEHYANAVDYGGFDLVLMIDSLEHIDKPLGHTILDTLLQNNKRVIVSCPDCTNHMFRQEAVNGNELERHRAFWTKEDFEVRGAKIIHSGVCVVASLKGKQ
jgi:2-polyprenyl-3-methyl-5-hydroxy-6-metoxy-1,4-benzoquinol methylase